MLSAGLYVVGVASDCQRCVGGAGGAEAAPSFDTGGRSDNNSSRHRVCSEIRTRRFGTRACMYMRQSSSCDQRGLKRVRRKILGSRFLALQTHARDMRPSIQVRACALFLFPSGSSNRGIWDFVLGEPGGVCDPVLGAIRDREGVRRIGDLCLVRSVL